jgi:hypothetical protein
LKIYTHEKRHKNKKKTTTTTKKHTHKKTWGEVRCSRKSIRKDKHMAKNQQRNKNKTTNVNTDRKLKISNIKPHQKLR